MSPLPKPSPTAFNPFQNESPTSNIEPCNDPDFAFCSVFAERIEASSHALQFHSFQKFRKVDYETYGTWFGLKISKFLLTLRSCKQREELDFFWNRVGGFNGRGSQRELC